jgi:hypothetical protein
MVFGGGGLVGVFDCGVVFEGGLVAGVVADFAAGGFAGQGAGAVVAGFVDAGGRLGPMFGLFHAGSIACCAREEKGVFTLWRAGVRRWQNERR